MRIDESGHRRAARTPDPGETFGACGIEREVDVNKDGYRPGNRIGPGFSPRLAVAGGALVGVAGLLAAGNAAAAVPSESQFVLSTFSFLLWGALVMWMCAGFTMLESGSVRTKNASVICLKNIGLYSIAGLAYYFVGYNLMYVDVGGWIGSLQFFYGPSENELALLSLGEDAAEETRTEAVGKVVENGYSTMSDWFFQMVFVATTASIVSGTLAERVKLWSFFLFIAVLTAVVYPVVGAWTWGGGWLTEMGFQDFAGSTIVHSTGGWAALAGVIVVGARKGKFRADGSVKTTPPSNVPVVTLGVFILWLGWFGFNGGSQLALGSGDDAAAMAQIFANTNLAAAAGTVVAMLAAQAIYGKVDLTMALNGALGGLVSITAEPLAPSFLWAILIGGVGGALVVLAVPLLDRFRIDDVVGAIPVHLVCGVWGTLAVPITNADASFGAQLLGIVAIGAFVAAASLGVWLALKAAMGIRLDSEAEDRGPDRSELGLEAWPEFGQGSQRI